MGCGGVSGGNAAGRRCRDDVTVGSQGRRIEAFDNFADIEISGLENFGHRELVAFVMNEHD